MLIKKNNPEYFNTPTHPTLHPSPSTPLLFFIFQKCYVHWEYIGYVYSDTCFVYDAPKLSKDVLTHRVRIKQYWEYGLDKQTITANLCHH